MYRHMPSGQFQLYRVTQMRTNDVCRRESAGRRPAVLEVARVTGATNSGYIMYQLLKCDTDRQYIEGGYFVVLVSYLRMTKGEYSCLLPRYYQIVYVVLIGSSSSHEFETVSSAVGRGRALV